MARIKERAEQDWRWRAVGRLCGECCNMAEWLHGLSSQRPDVRYQLVGECGRFFTRLTAQRNRVPGEWLAGRKPGARSAAIWPDRAPFVTSLRRFGEVIPGRLRPRSVCVRFTSPMHLATSWPRTQSASLRI